MDVCFVDDARQKKPSRPGMGPLVAIGGVHVPGGVAAQLEKGMESLCNKWRFPTGEEFKWSPGRDLWMRHNLREEKRQQFFTSVLGLVEGEGAKALVVVEDTACHTATDAWSPEEDVTRLFIERVHYQLGATGSGSILVVDRPGGSRKEEDKFLANCLDTLQSGTDYVKPDRIAFVVSTDSKFVRLLQVADLITSCTAALVSGEDRHSPPVFDAVKRLLRSDSGRIGGVGLKIHPDGRYMNLYHWLLGDTRYWKHSMGLPLPSSHFAYATSAVEP